MKFYLVEKLTHYKDELYLDFLINQKMNYLGRKRINLVYEKIEFNTENRKIKVNIPEDEFIETIKALKKKITEGDMFQVVPSRIYSYEHHFHHHLQQLTFQLYQN